MSRDDHLTTYSALISAASLALSAWRRNPPDSAETVHATNVLEFVLGSVDGDQVPDDVRRFRDGSM